MNYEKLDKKAVLAWRIGRAAGFCVLIAFLGFLLYGMRNIEELENYMKIVYIVAGALVIYKFAGIFIFPAIEYKQWKYIITDDKIEFSHGIFFVTTTVIPIIRVQHITISRGPVYRKLGLSKVKVFLASGSFEIIGLTEERADQISENLKARVIERLDSKFAEMAAE